MKVGEKIDAYKVGQRSFDPEETFAFVTHAGHRAVVWSWGAHAYVTHEDKFLRFKVQGRLFKGHVYIILGWYDTFTLYFTSSHGNIKRIEEGIYIDMLIGTIDGIVETP